jgi:hypothetical protein
MGRDAPVAAHAPIAARGLSAGMALGGVGHRTTSRATASAAADAAGAVAASRARAPISTFPSNRWHRPNLPGSAAAATSGWR